MLFSYETTGTIIHPIPNTNSYLVSLTGKDRGELVIPYLPEGSGTKIGPSSMHRLLPGEIVQISMGSSTKDHRILRAENNKKCNSSVQPFSVIPTDTTQGSWKDPLIQKYNDGAAYQATDACLYSGFSQGSVNEFGVGYWHSILHSSLRASDMSGIDAYLQDSLLRVKGYNYQLWTSMGESTVEASGHTSTDSKEKTWFLHEASGKNASEPFSIDKKTLELLLPDDNDPEQTYLTWKNSESPLDKYKLDALHQKYEQIQTTHPKILPREVSLHGYLGNGCVDYIARPGSQKVPSGVSTSTATGVVGVTGSQGFNSTDYLSNLFIPEDTPILTGLSEVKRASDGRVRISSAKGISLVKEISIPVPYRKSQDDEVTSDNFDVTQHIDPAVTSPTDSARSAARKSILLDSKDRRFIEKHPGWEFNEESGDLLSKSLSVGSEESGADYDPGPLTTHEYQTPPYTDFQVDPSTQAKYYKSRAGIEVTEDGSLMLFDAYGSSIVLSGGNIYFNCPGDIWQFPGRDFNLWGGRRINVKAQQGVEVASSNSDVKIKAQTQMSILGGAGGQNGGVLIQSKGQTIANTSKGSDMSSGGVVVKSDTYISQKASTIGIDSTSTAIKGVLSVDTSIDTPAVNTSDLQALAGSFGGTSAMAVASQTAVTAGSIGAAGVGATLTAPTPEESENNISAIPNGFLADTTNFSFNSSAQYGYTDGYNLRIMEAPWQTTYRLSSRINSATTWVEPDITGDDYGVAHPGKTMWNSDILRRPTTQDIWRLSPTDEQTYSFTNVPLSSNFLITQ